MDEARERSLRELLEPNMTRQPLCIVYSEIVVPFQLKLRLIHMLPYFMESLEKTSSTLKGISRCL